MAENENVKETDQSSEEEQQTVKDSQTSSKQEGKKRPVLEFIKNTGSNVKNSLTAIGDYFKKIFVSLGKKLLTFIVAFSVPILLVIGIVLFFVIIIAAVISLLVTSTTGLYQDGLYSSSAGAQGDCFYGERYFYIDYAYSAGEIADIYEEFTYNLLKDANDHNVLSVSIDFSKKYGEISHIVNISTDFAKSISSRNDVGQSIEYYTIGIDHYGLEIDESNQFIETMASYLKTNNLISVEKLTAETLLKALYLSSDYAYMRNVCSRIIIRDYLFDGDEAGLENLPKKNYLGMTFMQNKDMTINGGGFVFILDSGMTASASVCYVNEDGDVSEIDSAEADETWFDGTATTLFDVDLSSSPVKEFRAFDGDNQQYLQEGKSLFQIFRDGKYFEFFNNIDGDYSFENIINHINTDSYIYIKAEVSPDGYYIVADAMLDY